MDNKLLKYAAIYGPILVLISMVGGWVFHVESGLQRANDVTSLREQINGVNRDLGYQRGRIANLEQLFEPYLVQKKAEELMKKMATPPVPPHPAPAMPKSVTKAATEWARSQIQRGVENEEKPDVERASDKAAPDKSLFEEKVEK